MASASVLQKLTERAKQAEEIIAQLKQQIETVKQTAAISASKPEEERIRNENQILKKEIEQLKSILILAEIKNGVKQIPMPTKKAKVEASKTEEPAPVSQTPAQTEAPVAKETNKQKSKQQKGGEKGKKDAEGGETKEKKGGKKPVDPNADRPVDISRLDMRVGKIVAVEKHPDADTLYVEQVDLGEGKPRTIVSGLVKHVPIEEMQDRLALFMCNLKAAKMRGILSHGMIMCANGADRTEILVPPPGSVVGDRVFAKGYTDEPDALLNPKKKIWETIKPDLRTDGEKVAAYKGCRLSIEGKGLVVTPTQADSQIS